MRTKKDIAQEIHSTTIRLEELTRELRNLTTQEDKDQRKESTEDKNISSRNITPFAEGNRVEITNKYKGK